MNASETDEVWKTFLAVAADTNELVWPFFGLSLFYLFIFGFFG
jgi:hypothetical protein